MIDKSQLQVRLKDGDSSLSLPMVRPALIARGRRDAAILTELPSPAPTEMQSGKFLLTNGREVDVPPDSAFEYLRGEVSMFSQEDYAEALAWWRQAADAGSTEAQYILGAAYRDGDGVPQNHVLAYAWFSLCASNGDFDKYVSKALDDVVKELTAQQIIEAQGLAKDWQS